MREINCSACGKETLVRVEPVYDGFRKTGERFLCASCGHAYASESEVPFKAVRKVAVFTDADRTAHVDVFAGDEKGRNCRYCGHYVVNPFTQRCGLTDRIVQATDTCPTFERAAVKKKAEPAAEPSAGRDPLADRLKEEHRRRGGDVE